MSDSCMITARGFVVHAMHDEVDGHKVEHERFSFLGYLRFVDPCLQSLDLLLSLVATVIYTVVVCGRLIYNWRVENTF